MSWIITRQKKAETETYVDADIYGRGKWKSDADRTSLFDLPVQYVNRYEAAAAVRRERNSDPDWQYHIEYYE